MLLKAATLLGKYQGEGQRGLDVHHGHLVECRPQVMATAPDATGYVSAASTLTHAIKELQPEAEGEVSDL